MNDRQLKKYIDDQVNEQIQILRSELMRYIDKRLEKKIDDNNNKQIIAVKNSVKTEVQAIIQRDVMPQIDSAMEYVNYQLQDGTELVTEYRKRVWEQSKAGHKMITDGGGADKYDFGNSQFFFNDND